MQDLSALYPDWPQYAARLVAAVRDQPASVLALRGSPGQLPIWGLAAHTAGTRVYWLCGILGEPGADTTPFKDPLAEMGWEDDPDHPRSADELVWALESSWNVVAGCLERWTLDGLGKAFDRTYGGVTVRHTRASVLNRMLSHDAFHAGEISQLQGAHGLDGIDLWRRPRPGE